MEPVKQCVARMARSDIRERWCGFLGCSRISLALNAGYKLGPRFRGDDSGLIAYERDQFFTNRRSAILLV